MQDMKFVWNNNVSIKEAIHSHRMITLKLNVWTMNYRFHFYMYWSNTFSFIYTQHFAWAESPSYHIPCFVPHNYMINRTESEKFTAPIMSKLRQKLHSQSAWHIHSVSIIFNQLANESEWIVEFHRNFRDHRFKLSRILLPVSEHDY